MKTLEFRIPISPNPGFFMAVRLIARSLAALGPPYSTARILVSVGEYAELAAVRHATPWAAAFPIEWRVTPHDRFEALSHIATSEDRYAERAGADVIVLCDADICPVARFDELFDQLADPEPRVAGLQAHWPAVERGSSAEDNDAEWRRLLKAARLPTEAGLTYPFSFDFDGVMGKAPAYFNYGFVAFNRSAFERVAPVVGKYTNIAWGLLENPQFSGQIGLALAIAATGVGTIHLGHAYNCANDDLVFLAGLRSEDEINVIHYLRGDEFDRRSFLADPEALRKFLGATNLNRVNERLRRHIASLPDLAGMPEPAPAAPRPPSRLARWRRAVLGRIDGSARAEERYR